MFIQFCQGAVDRGEAYPRNLLLDMVEYRSGRGMLVRGEKVVKDGIPLRRDAEPFFPHLGNNFIFRAIGKDGPTPYLE